MEENHFRKYFAELNDKTLVEKLRHRNGHQAEAKQAMIEEAIERKLIADASDDAISIGLEKFRVANTNIEKESFLSSINWDRKIYNGFASLFVLAGFFALLKIPGSPFYFIAVAAFMFYLAVYCYRMPAKIARYEKGLIQYNRQGDTLMIKAGYFFSFLGGIMGMLIGIDLYFSGRNMGEGRLYEYNANTRRHGLVIMIISAIMFVLWKVLSKL